MEIIALFVASKNLKVTNGTSIYPQDWISQEDQELFKQVKDEFQVYLMGSRTYNEIADHIVLSSEHKRVIFTSKPGKYKEVEIPGELEFTSESPTDISNRLDSEGYQNALFLGGPTILVAFLTEKLISELRLTIEPVELEEGLNLFPPETDLATDFILKSSRKLNNNGTVHNVYTVRK